MSKSNSSNRDWKRATGPRIQGTVKWYNVKKGFGFIVRDDTKTDVFVHRTAISRNPRKVVPSVGDGEAVDFCVVTTQKGERACAVSGPNGTCVQGSRYARNRRRRRLRNSPPRQAACGDLTSRELTVSIGIQTAHPEERDVNSNSSSKQSVSDTVSVAEKQTGFVCQLCHSDSSTPTAPLSAPVQTKRPVPAPRKTVVTQSEIATFEDAVLLKTQQSVLMLKLFKSQILKFNF